MQWPGRVPASPMPHLVIPPFLGGCEGLAMLNRTNQTLSALALSNRLNLGTRSLAVNASVNDGVQTLRTRHAYHDLMRDGMAWFDVFSIPTPKHAIPSIPSSSTRLQPDPEGSSRLQRVVSVVGVVVEPEPRPADLVDRPEPCADACDSRFRTTATSDRARATTTARLSSIKRSSSKSLRDRGSKLALWRATSDAAAASALSGK